MKSILCVFILVGFSPVAGLALVYNDEYIPKPYESYAEILVEATVEFEGGDVFTGALALYDRGITVEWDKYTRVVYVPIKAGTVIEKLDANTTRITTPEEVIYEGKASTKNGSIVLVCKKLEPFFYTKIMMNLQAKYNYVSGVKKIERIEVHRILDDEYVEKWAPELADTGGGTHEFDESIDSLGY
jgi:hypothetical protein